MRILLKGGVADGVGEVVRVAALGADPDGTVNAKGLVTNGKVWEQSYNGNYTDLPEWIVNVDENVEYGLYLDDYGYIRAYDNKTTYALVTEIYPTNGMNQAWLTSHTLTAEVMTASGDDKELGVVHSAYVVIMREAGVAAADGVEGVGVLDVGGLQLNIVLHPVESLL